MSEKTKHLEIERRWLLSGLPKREILYHFVNDRAKIITVYIVSDPQVEMRIRKRRDLVSRNTTFPVVTKIGQGLTRQESPKLSANEKLFHFYFILHKPRPPFTAEKYWKIYPTDDLSGREVEIKYLTLPPSLCGLTLAEIEFDSEEEARQFSETDFPEWLNPLVVKEVTEDPRYNGKNLALHGRPNPV